MMSALATLSAQGGGFGSGMGWNDNLNLTSDQIKQIEAFHSDFRKSQIEARREIKNLRLNLQELLRSEHPDQGAIDEVLAKIEKKETSMEQLRVDHHWMIRDLLTDQQKSLFDQHSFERGMGHHGRNDFKGHMGGKGSSGMGNGHGEDHMNGM